MATHREIEPAERADDLKEVIGVARTVIAQEVQITERLEGKARQQVALGAQWFAIVQAVLAVALNSKGVDHRWLLWTAAAIAVCGGLVLAVTVTLSWRVWRIRGDEEVTPAGLLQMREYAHRPERGVMDELIEYHAHLLQERRQRNTQRADNAETAEIAWFVCMAVPLAELGFALAAILMP